MIPLRDPSKSKERSQSNAVKLPRESKKPCAAEERHVGEQASEAEVERYYHRTLAQRMNNQGPTPIPDPVAEFSELDEATAKERAAIEAREDVERRVYARQSEFHRLKSGIAVAEKRLEKFDAIYAEIQSRLTCIERDLEICEAEDHDPHMFGNAVVDRATRMLGLEDAHQSASALLGQRPERRKRLEAELEQAKKALAEF